MKELLLRLRHWLIRKLGGYTEQKAQPALRYYPMFSTLLHPERVTANVRMSYGDVMPFSGDIDREKIFSAEVKEALSREIVDGIIDKGYAVLSCEPDLIVSASDKM